jgi:hypothetical protein
MYLINLTSSIQTKFIGRLISGGNPSIPTDFQRVFPLMVGWAMLDEKDLMYGLWCENKKCTVMTIDIVKVQIVSCLPLTVNDKTKSPIQAAFGLAMFVKKIF